MRRKLPEEKRKKKSSISINTELLEVFKIFLKGKNIKNVSKYIGNLIRIDLEERGEDIKSDF